MIEYIKGVWARFEVHWHAVAAACIVVAPEALDKLGYVDLRPILEPFLGYEKTNALLGLLPIVLLFLKPVFKVAAHPDSEDTSGKAS